MGLLTRNTTPAEPTLEERANGASATAAAALSMFDLAAADLEQAAAEHADVAAQAEAEVLRLNALREQADYQATIAINQARRIRNLVAGDLS